MNFVAIDVETANADLSSICQIGVAVFTEGKLTNRWSSLIDPEDEFDGINISIHGIDEEAVLGAPKLPDAYNELSQFLRDQFVICHTSFGRTALHRAHARYNLTHAACTWVDPARLARRAWPQFSQRGYGLANVADFLKITFKHHDALEDACAAGEIALRAMAEIGITPSECNGWLARKKSERIALEGAEDGPMVGEVIVFTGALSLPRREAAEMAAKVGFDVAASVTKNTTILVVGDLDARRLSGHEKSSKHRKAEDMRRNGHPIQIVTESDFQSFIGIAE